MKKLKSHFKFNKQERSGIFFLLLTIILLQVGYFIWKSISADDQVSNLQVDSEMQAQIDALKEKALEGDSIRIFPFNPNFISDYKGYTLGMSVDEIDRLHNFRKTNKYVNSPEEFQQVTQVSDGLLNTISPYFKFPEWAQKGKQQLAAGARLKTSIRKTAKPQKFSISDLNSASESDLKSINGIGEKLSVRIIKFRDRLGGFLTDEQLSHVYGLEPEVVQRVLERFKVLNRPTINKIVINEASTEELTELVYINYYLASKIVDYRDTNGGIVTFNELATIEGFPSKKLDIIQLYLSLN